MNNTTETTEETTTETAAEGLKELVPDEVVFTDHEDGTVSMRMEAVKASSVLMCAAKAIDSFTSSILAEKVRDNGMTAAFDFMQWAHGQVSSLTELGEKCDELATKHGQNDAYYEKNKKAGKAE